MKRSRFLLLLPALGVLAVLLTVFRPAAEEVDDTDSPTVSESDIQLYINVYRAMQQDHDLSIDAAIQPYHMSLDDFRQLERRIQNQPRLVDRVREALLDAAKAHSVFAQAMASPTPGPTAVEPKSKQRHKKQ
jgi:hypothetical protein